MNLPSNIYTNGNWKVDPAQPVPFLPVCAPNAHANTKKIFSPRVYADAICNVVARWGPRRLPRLRDYRLGGATMSNNSFLECIRRMVGEDVIAGRPLA